MPEGRPLPPQAVLPDLLAEVGLSPALAESVQLTGRDPVLPSSFAAGTVSHAARLTHTLARWELPVVPLGHHRAEWT